MDLTLTYSEAIDFIINLDLANLSHDNHKAFIYEARKILCSYLAEGKPDSEKVITFSPEENYKFEPVERDCSFWIEKPGLPFPRPAEELIEKEKYSSDGIRAFMENKSLKERCSGWSVATAKEAKQIAREDKDLKTLKKENERLKAELEQKGKLSAVAKAGRPIKYTKLPDAIIQFVEEKKYKGKGQDTDFINGVLERIPQNERPKSNSTITKAFQRLQKTGKIE